MIDIKLDPLTHDLVLENGDFVLIDEIESIKQGLTIRLGIIFQEWYLDNSIGIISTQEDKPDPDDTVRRVREEILKEDGVTSIEEFQEVFDASTRELNIRFKCNTIYGELTQEEGVSF